MSRPALFDAPRVRRNVKRARFDDGGAEAVRFRCHRCGWVSAWLFGVSNADCRRGIPCPTCNAV